MTDAKGPKRGDFSRGETGTRRLPWHTVLTNVAQGFVIDKDFNAKIESLLFVSDGLDGEDGCDELSFVIQMDRPKKRG